MNYDLIWDRAPDQTVVISSFWNNFCQTKTVFDLNYVFKLEKFEPGSLGREADTLPNELHYLPFIWKEW